MRISNSLKGWLAFAACGALTVVLGAGAGCDSGSDTNVGGSAAHTGTGASSTGGEGGMLITTGGTGTGGHEVSCTPPCEDGEICSHGVCVPQTACSTDDDCQNDTYCDPQLGCLPWSEADPSHDPGCVQAIPVGVFAPTIQCAFSEAAADDPFPGHVDVQGTPIVVNFNKPLDSGSPSIAASFCEVVPQGYHEDRGVIRVLSGTDCSVEAVLGGVDLDGDNNVDWTVSCAALAAGDLDGDGVAEIVAYGDDGETFAFTRKLVNWQQQWSLLWKAPYPAGAPWAPCNHTNHRCSYGWAGPSIHDIDDDGVPEVIREGVVFAADGSLLSLQPATYAGYSVGLPPVLANFDQDPAIEFTNGQYLWEWSAGAWVQEAGFSSPGPGWVAVADFGDYGTGNPPEAPEIALVRSGTVAVYATTGELVQAPIPVPAGGTGGPPTISDFDGDGLAELGVAARDAYTVYDLDCGPNPRPTGSCPDGPCDYLPGGTIPQFGGPCPVDGGVAWARGTQDHSSSITGSSIFDFEDNGSAEVIYADECFVRVYDGPTGDVIFSQYRSSCTWLENPLVADVDGDFRAELITPSNKACSAGGAGIVCSMNVAPDPNFGDPMDLLFNGVRCDTGADCLTGLCDAGLCRCTVTADCCAANDDAACREDGYSCAPPEAGTPGSGSTCRSVHPHGVSGIRVYHDSNDLWVKSRMIWNQHAYAVTHVEENGAIPQSSAWSNNWDDPDLNNFRQNVPGEADGSALGDTTAGASDTYSCQGESAVMQVAICNRGATAVPPGIVVGFYAEGQKICETETTGAILPEECEIVTCTWDDPPSTANDALDVTVVADDGGGVTECKEGNNEGIVLGVYCQPPT